MEESAKKEIENLVEYFRAYGAKSAQHVLAFLLLWLFGNLVFIPLARSINWQTKFIVSLIFLTAFTIRVAVTLPRLKKLVDLFSIFPARKYCLKKGLTYEDSLILFRRFFYIAIGIMLYLLYYPFLTNFHPSISGIVIILMLIWIFFLSLRVSTVLFPRFIEWLVKR